MSRSMAPTILIFDLPVPSCAQAALPGGCLETHVHVPDTRIPPEIAEGSDQMQEQSTPGCADIDVPGVNPRSHCGFRLQMGPPGQQQRNILG